MTGDDMAHDKDLLGIMRRHPTVSNCVLAGKLSCNMMWQPKADLHIVGLECN